MWFVIQSLLRGRFLRTERTTEDERPPSVAARELLQLRQRNTVSDLRCAHSFIVYIVSPISVIENSMPYPGRMLLIVPYMPVKNLLCYAYWFRPLLFVINWHQKFQLWAEFEKVPTLINLGRSQLRGIISRRSSAMLKLLNRLI